jgi:hypothetical protein
MPGIQAPEEDPREFIALPEREICSRRSRSELLDGLRRETPLLEDNAIYATAARI